MFVCFFDIYNIILWSLGYLSWHWAILLVNDKHALLAIPPKQMLQSMR